MTPRSALTAPAVWLEAAIAEKVGYVAEIHEQYRCRQQRRDRVELKKV
jgi:hypothetical protein